MNRIGDEREKKRREEIFDYFSTRPGLLRYANEI